MAGDPDMRECDFCGGLFFPEDMDGDHCNGCAEDLFGDDASDEVAG